MWPAKARLSVELLNVVYQEPGLNYATLLIVKLTSRLTAICPVYM